MFVEVFRHFVVISVGVINLKKCTYITYFTQQNVPKSEAVLYLNTKEKVICCIIFVFLCDHKHSLIITTFS